MNIILLFIVLSMYPGKNHNIVYSHFNIQGSIELVLKMNEDHTCLSLLQKISVTFTKLTLNHFIWKVWLSHFWPKIFFSSFSLSLSFYHRKGPTQIRCLFKTQDNSITRQEGRFAVHLDLRCLHFLNISFCLFIHLRCYQE